jgi:LysR family carnitine catabolism transcriptional activator
MIDGIRQIKAFSAIARLGNFTRASLELHISQSALSVQIQQLESALGVTLLERNKRRVALTRAGEEMLPPLEHILFEVESLVGTGRDFATLRRGLITVAAVPSTAATLLPIALRHFSKSYPGVIVRLKDVVAGNFLELVRSDEVDFGIGSEIYRDRTVTMQYLRTERLCAFAPLSHPLAKKQRIALSELIDYPVILPEKNSSVRMTLERALKQQNLSVRILFETSHISTAMGLVKADLGIAVLPLPAIDCYPSSNIRCVAITNPVLERKIVIAGKAKHPFSPAVQKLIEILHQVVRDSPPRIRRPRSGTNGADSG